MFGTHTEGMQVLKLFVRKKRFPRPRAESSKLFAMGAIF